MRQVGHDRSHYAASRELESDYFSVNRTPPELVFNDDDNDEEERPKPKRSCKELCSLYLHYFRIRKRYYILLFLAIVIGFLFITSETFFDKVIYSCVIWYHRLENFYQDLPWHVLPFFSAYQQFTLTDKFESQQLVQRGTDSYCTIHDEVHLLVNMRVPKTAGTTATDLLRELSTPNHFLLSLSSRLHIKSQEEIDNREKDMTSYFSSFDHKTALSSHVRFLDFVKHGHPEPLYIGTFRHPIERMQSHYHYDAFSDRPLYVDYKLWVKGELGLIKPTLTQCVRKFIGMKIFPSDIPYGTDGYVADSKIRSRLDRIPKEYSCLKQKYISVQLKYYCGYHRSCKTLENPAEMLDIARKNLGRFQVIMLTDKMHDSVHILEKMLPNYFRGASHVYENYENEFDEDLGMAEAIALDNMVLPPPYTCGESAGKGNKRRYCSCNGTLYYGRKYPNFSQDKDGVKPLTLDEMRASQDYLSVDVRRTGGMHCTHKHRAFRGGFPTDPVPKLPKQCVCSPIPAHDPRKSKLNEIFHMRSNKNTKVQSRIELIPDDIQRYLEGFLSNEMRLYEEVKKHFQNNRNRCGV